jgi:hypothetical protein
VCNHCLERIPNYDIYHCPICKRSWALKQIFEISITDEQLTKIIDKPQEIENGDCLQFEPKPKGVEKIPPHTMSSANYIEKKINEIIDAVNELRRELEGK